MLSFPPPAELKAKLFLELRWLWTEHWDNLALAGAGPAHVQHAGTLSCSHWTQGKLCLELSGGPPDLQLLLGDLHKGTQCWPRPNLRHGKLQWWLRKFTNILEAGVAGRCQGGCHPNLWADWGKCLSGKAALVGWVINKGRRENGKPPGRKLHWAWARKQGKKHIDPDLWKTAQEWYKSLNEHFCWKKKEQMHLPFSFVLVVVVVVGLGSLYNPFSTYF